MSTPPLLADGRINPEYRAPARVKPEYDKGHPLVAAAFKHFAPKVRKASQHAKK